MQEKQVKVNMAELHKVAQNKKVNYYKTMKQSDELKKDNQFEVFSEDAQKRM